MNHYDLSTRHASTLAAVTSTFGTVGAILVPVATGELTINQVFIDYRFIFYVYFLTGKRWVLVNFN